jgi:hypothetical protein
MPFAVGHAVAGQQFCQTGYDHMTITMSPSLVCYFYTPSIVTFGYLHRYPFAAGFCTRFAHGIPHTLSLLDFERSPPRLDFRAHCGPKRLMDI